MAIKESIKNAPKKIMNEFKKKPVFYSALFVVVAFALYKFFNSTPSSDSYSPTDFSSYPNYSGGSSGDSGGGSTVTDGDTGGNNGGSTIPDDTGGGGYDSEYWDDYWYSYYKKLDNKNKVTEEKELVTSTPTKEVMYAPNGMPYTSVDTSLIDGKNAYNATVEMRDNILKMATASVTEYDVLNSRNQQLAKIANLQYDANEGSFWNNWGERVMSNPTNTGTIHSSTIAQMQKNASDWSKASSQAEKARLAQENQKLGQSIGGVYDASTGRWKSSNGTDLLVYSTPSKTSTTTSKNTSTNKNVSYDKNVDYAQKINDARSSGASQKEIENLQKQREAKIAGENLTSTGKAKTSTGNSSTATKSTPTPTTTKSTPTTTKSNTSSNSISPFSNSVINIAKGISKLFG